MKTFKILGLLLSYPQPQWLAHLDEFKPTLLAEGLLPQKQLRAVLGWVEELQAADLYRLQEAYVATFDRGRSHCLHLFEHIHGESRDRGQAMVNLADAYAEKGLFIDQAELPDYLPLFLEFLSLCPLTEALALLAEPIDIMATLATRLHKRDSSYAVLFDALVALSRVKPNHEKIQQVVAAEPEGDSLEALDKEWQEAAAFAGQPGQSGCGGCNTRPAGLQINITG